MKRTTARIITDTTDGVDDAEDAGMREEKVRMEG